MIFNPLSENYDIKLDNLISILGVTEDVDIAKCKLYLETAGDVIKEIRQYPFVEDKYSTLQVQMAVELFNKQGIEGQISHSENGISRSFASTFISKHLLDQITPRVKSVCEDISQIPMPLRRF